MSLLGLPGWLAALAEGDLMLLGDAGGSDPVVSEYESTMRQMDLPPDLRRRLQVGGPQSIPALVHDPGVAVRVDGWKYVAVAGREEALFDLGADPSEEHDVLDVHPSRADVMRAHRDAWEHRRTRSPRYSTGEVADAQIADHLRELGYIE